MVPQGGTGKKLRIKLSVWVFFCKKDSKIGVTAFVKGLGGLFPPLNSWWMKRVHKVVSLYRLVRVLCKDLTIPAQGEQAGERREEEG